MGVQGFRGASGFQFGHQIGQRGFLIRVCQHHSGYFCTRPIDREQSPCNGIALRVNVSRLRDADHVAQHFHGRESRFFFRRFLLILFLRFRGEGRR